MTHITNVTVYVDWEDVRERVAEVAMAHLDKRHAKLTYQDPAVSFDEMGDGYLVTFTTEE